MKGKAVLTGTHFINGDQACAMYRDFREVLEHLWWRLDRKLTLEDAYYSALHGMIEAVRKGATTLIDHHAGPGALLPKLCGQCAGRTSEKTFDVKG